MSFSILATEPIKIALSLARVPRSLRLLQGAGGFKGVRVNDCEITPYSDGHDGLRDTSTRPLRKNRKERGTPNPIPIA
jgi:hypothetical protein